jgi:hypothetical protein
MPTLLDPPRTRHASIVYPGLGIFIAGGRGADRAPLASIDYWDGYVVAEGASQLWQLTLPRIDLSGVPASNGLIYWVGGADANGVPVSIGELMDPTGQLASPPVQLVQPGGQVPLSRTESSAALGSEGMLLFGGRDTSGNPAAGALLFTDTLGIELIQWTDNVPRIGASVTPILGGSQIIVFGGGPPGSRQVERYVSRTSVQVFDPAPVVTNRRDHTATLLSDGRILLLGGTDDTGQALRSAVVYDPTRNVAEERPDFLAQPRTLHTATRASTEIVVLGGQGPAGLVPTVEVYDIQTLARLREVPIGSPRIHHSADDPGNGAVVVLGGEDLAGNPVAPIEIYQPGVGP